MEDSRHKVSDRVLLHYRALQSGEVSETAEAESNRRPLEGDWYFHGLPV